MNILVVSVLASLIGVGLGICLNMLVQHTELACLEQKMSPAQGYVRAILTSLVCIATVVLVCMRVFALYSFGLASFYIPGMVLMGATILTVYVANSVNSR